MKILVFDRDGTRSAYLEKIVTSLGYEKVNTEPGDDPIDILRFLEASTLPDLVFCAGEKGLELCRRWKKEERELLHPFVYMIYVGDPDDEFRAAVMDGVNDFLVWPPSEKFVEARIMLAEVAKKERDEGSLDHLTKVLNRRALEEALGRELDRARRQKTTLGLIFLDVDDFKKINDRMGHEAGDSFLRELTDSIKASIREYDHLGRYGGDEFVVLIVDCAMEDLLNKAEELRKKVPQPFTVSIGIALSDGSREGKKLLNKADTLLCKAKQNGKNRVEHIIDGRSK